VRRERLLSSAQASSAQRPTGLRAAVLAEYRPQNFETAVQKLAFFFVLLALVVLLFNALTLPWLSESFSRPEPLHEGKAPSLAKPNDKQPPLPPPPSSSNAESRVEAGKSAEINPPPLEEQPETTPAPSVGNPLRAKRRLHHPAGVILSAAGISTKWAICFFDYPPGG